MESVAQLPISENADGPTSTTEILEDATLPKAENLKQRRGHGRRTLSESAGAQKRRESLRAMSPTTAIVKRAKNADREVKNTLLRKLRTSEVYQDAGFSARKDMEDTAVKNLMEHRKTTGRDAASKEARAIQNRKLIESASYGAVSTPAASSPILREWGERLIKDIRSEERKKTRLNGKVAGEKKR